MYLKEQFTMYKLAHDLMTYNHYDVLHINNDKEIWLEKYEHKTSKIVRLFHGGFDWRNHLKNDIAVVFQKVKSMQRLLIGKRIVIHNVYISSHEPVDDWEFLKKPMQLKEKNSPQMRVYYMTDDTKNEELKRLRTDAHLMREIEIEAGPEEDAIERLIHDYKSELIKVLQHNRKEEARIFSRGKPFFTFSLIIINILMFLLLERHGGSMDTETLIHFGAKYNPLIMDGQWWRILSSMFLHIGFLHLFMNMLALYYLGTTVEKIYGSWRFLIIYFLSGIGGGLASFALTTNVSAGASGALFGLFGALLFFGVIYKKLFFQTMGRGLLVIIAINIILGFSVEHIDIGAHLGGLITGFFASSLVHLPKKRHIAMQLAGFGIYIVIILGLTFFGMHNNLHRPSYHLQEIDGYLDEQNYEAVIESADKGLENPGDLKPQLLFQRAFAYIHLNEPDLALAALQEVIKREKDFPQAYYNLAVLYDDMEEREKAVDIAYKAYKLNPHDEAYRALYKEISSFKER